MNNLIEELAEQAVKAVDNPFPGNPLNDELAKMYIPDCFAEKFAELIVLECTRVILRGDDGYVSMDLRYGVGMGKGIAVKLIKEHFGGER